MSHAKGFIAPLIAIIIIVALGVGGYVFLQYQRAKNEKGVGVPVPIIPEAPWSPPASTTAQNPAPAPAPSSSTSSTIPTDWKTYRNEKYGFEVRYPADHSPYSKVEQDRLVPATTISDRVNIAVDEAKVICCEPASISIQIDNTTGHELENSKLQRARFNNLDVLIWIGEGNLGSIHKIMYLKNPSGNWIKIIQSAQSDLLDQILSTFRFTK